MIAPSDSSRGATLAKLGAFMQTAQLAGLVAMLVSINQGMSGMSPVPVSSEETQQQASIQAAVLEHAAQYMFLGVGIAVVGLVMVIVAATVHRYRAEWFFWFMCLYGGAACFSYLLPFGLFLVIYALRKKKEFPLDAAPVPGTPV